MKRMLIKGLMLLSVTGLLLAPSPVLAQTLQPSGATPVDRLQARCDAIRPVLRRLHTSDALLRVNIGQSYTVISQRLIARLNSRLALNRVDNARLLELTAIAGRLETARTAFAHAYGEYENAIATLVRIDCRQRSTEFYQQLLIARDARHKLAKSVQSMNETVSDYQVSVEALRQSLEGRHAGN